MIFARRRLCAVHHHLIHGSLNPPESSTQTASRSVQLFLQGNICGAIPSRQYIRQSHCERSPDSADECSVSARWPPTKTTDPSREIASWLLPFTPTIAMAALRSRCGHYIFALWFLSFFFLFSSPNRSGRRLDVYHTSTHGVALVCI